MLTIKFLEDGVQTEQSFETPRLALAEVVRLYRLDPTICKPDSTSAKRIIGISGDDTTVVKAVAKLVLTTMAKTNTRNACANKLENVSEAISETVIALRA